MNQLTEPSAGLDQRHAYIEAANFKPPAGGAPLPRPRIPWLVASLTTFFLLVFWAMWFVVTARSVGLVASPDSASITVKEWPAPRVGKHWLMREGARRVVVEAPGYQSFNGEIEVTDAQIQSHEIILERLPGSLNVQLSPAVEAVLWLDGKNFTALPGLTTGIAAGDHLIEIRADRYLTYQAEIAVEGKGIVQHLELTLDPAWADVTIDSVPGPADVRVDGEVVGRTPVVVEVLAGPRVLELDHPGYKRWQQTLKIASGVAVDIGEIVLAKADGQLALTSQPTRANVTVNGEFRGQTPLAIALEAGRKHRLEVRKEGYLSQRRDLRLESAKATTLEMLLKPELATIQFITTPSDAELLIDGKSRGNATQTLRLPTHEHELTVRRAGYATYQTQVTPRKGVKKRFRIRLKKADQSTSGKVRPAPTTIPKGSLKTFAGQEMKLFSGGKATLGTGRNAPYRRANESQRDVVLSRPFYLSLKEVTNAEYRQFLAAHHSGEFSKPSLDNPAQAVVSITWGNAALYCDWLSRSDGLSAFYQIKHGEVLGINPDSNGYRLPTEAEWEWAGRWPPAGKPSQFPSDDTFPPRGRSGNYADATAASIMDEALATYNDGFAVAAPVGSFAPNLKGLYDMEGNVAEWVHDFYVAAPTSSLAPDPLGSQTGQVHVVKGASWTASSATKLRYSFRDSSAQGRHDLGFRLARYAQ